MAKFEMALCCADRSKKNMPKKWNTNCNHVLVWDQQGLKEETSDELVRPQGKLCDGISS